jgi:regulation of enolase protein 1 (concanavalin A-like superfamily)
MARLINNVNETGEWTKVFFEVTIIVIENKPVVAKYSDHCTISLIAQAAKIVARLLRRRKEKELKTRFEKTSLDLEEEKELEK